MQWLVVRYARQNMEQILEAIRIAKQEGLSVSLDLASFEVWPQLIGTVRSFFGTGTSLILFIYYTDGSWL